jgi:hypothetical protein
MNAHNIIVNHQRAHRGDYILALQSESGEWEMLDIFPADSDDEANEYAAANYQHLDWYVLDWQGGNING